jgi:outer membrane protein assembly factor BamB/dienelactone hydrolase
MKKQTLFLLLILLCTACAAQPSPTATPIPTSTPAPELTIDNSQLTIDNSLTPTTPPTAQPTPTAEPTTAPLFTPDPGRPITFDTPDGATLEGTLYGQGTTAVIFGHMGDQRQATWTEVAQRVAAHGYLALTFDFRFWQDGRMVDDLRQHAPADMAAALAFVRQQGAQRVVLVGASLGGMAAIKVAAANPVDGLAVFAAPLGPVSVGFQVDIADIEAIHTPTLFVVTENDRMASDIEQMYAAAHEPKAIEVYSGGLHGTELFATDQAETVIERLIAFLEEHNPPTAAQLTAPAFEFAWVANDEQYPNPSPVGLALDSSGRLYVIDSIFNRIHLFDADGQFLELWEGGEAEGPFKFSNPACCHDLGDIAIDPAGNIYVLDSYHQRVLKYDPNRNLLLTFGSEGEGDGFFTQPANLALDGEGNIYITDEATYRLQKFSPTGEFLTAWGSEGNGDGQWNGRGWPAVDPRGFVYVTDAGNGRVLKFDTEGNFLFAWGRPGTGPGQFNTPTDIALDSAGHVYVVEYHGNRVQKFDQWGNWLASWGQMGFTPSSVNKPMAVTVDPAGNIYIADTGNDHVQMVRQFAASTPTTTSVATTLFRGGPQRLGSYDVAPLSTFTEVGWQRQIGSGGLGGPVLVGNILYVSSQAGRLFALDSASGESIWARNLARELLSPVAVAGGVVYVGSDRNRLYALDSQTGETLWEFETLDQVFTAPLLLDGRAYIGSRDGTVYAVDLATHEAVWQYQTDSWLIWSIAAEDGRLFIATDAHLHALDAETGAELWSADNGTYWNAPLVDNGRVYAGSGDNYFYAFNAATGETVWRFQASDAPWSPPALANGLIYVGNVNQTYYALDAETGEERWQFAAADWAVTDPAVAGNVVYLGEGNHDRREQPSYLYALDATTGEELWRFQATTRLLTAPMPADHAVYILTITGLLYALQ